VLTLFWISIGVLIYVYLGYPLVLRLGVLGRRTAVLTGPIQPSISIIVAAHNEEAVIGAKLKNLLASNYPRELVEVLIGSDGSSDCTEAIVRPFAAEGVGLISFPQQQGKSAMQNGLAEVASGSILFFTDADCLFAPGALTRIVEHFADPRVGLVTARPSYRNESETCIIQNESFYLRYETWLREQESARGVLAMASGSLFAIRRSLWKPLDRNLGDDFVLPLRVAQAGLRNVLEPGAVAFTRLSQDEPVSLLRLKVRIISKDFRALLVHGALLNPARYGPIAVSLWSHKLLRWLAPYFLLAVFVANSFLLDQTFSRVSFFLQSGFYALAVLGALRGTACERGERLTNKSANNSITRLIWSLPMSFCVVNLAALLGTLKCLTGGTSGHWKTERTQSRAY
jgi:cellulose synthase/poly-beta-1,6-N-acetylglucosamine synthase-like glycosyltransferase